MIPTTTTVVGNLTHDPELRFTPSGLPVTTFGVAVNRRRQENGQWVDARTYFFNVTCWRHLAENVADTLVKGARVIVYGQLQQREWETENGDKRNAVEIVSDAVGPDLTFATAEVTKVERKYPDKAPHPADAHEEGEEPF